VKVVFEQDSNFWTDSLTWVPTFEEVDRISKTLVGIDAVYNNDEINVSILMKRSEGRERT